MPHPFQLTLDGFAQPGASEAADPAPPPAPLGGPSFVFAADAPLEPGSHFLWERAEDWVPEAEPAPALAPAPAPPPARAHPQPSIDPAVIAVELGLTYLSTADDLGRARRKFMWENHPDRRPDVSREIAHRRVSTANMLLDRALAHIARRHRKA